jgi:hypothetical protein
VLVLLIVYLLDVILAYVVFLVLSSRSTVVSTVTRLQAGRSGVRISAEAKYFSVRVPAIPLYNLMACTGTTLLFVLRFVSTALPVFFVDGSVRVVTSMIEQIHIKMLIVMLSVCELGNL